MLGLLSPWSVGFLTGANGSGIAETCPIRTIKRTSAKIICLTVRTPVDFLDWTVKYMLMIYRLMIYGKMRWKGFFFNLDKNFFFRENKCLRSSASKWQMSACEENFNEKMCRLYRYFSSSKNRGLLPLLCNFFNKDHL